MRNGDVSFWWSALGGTPSPRAPLPGDRDVDVCIVGGGYTGLWTAYYLAREAPQLRIVVLERAFCGFGASGRNGGWVEGELYGSREREARRTGRDAVVRQGAAIAATVDEIARVTAAESIDCDFVRGGALYAATNAVRLGRLREMVAEEREWGRGEDDIRELDAAEVRARIAIEGAVGGALLEACARIQPAKLVAGLADAVVRRGVVVHEATPVVDLASGRAVTPFGTVRAPVVLRCTEGYTSGLPGNDRLLLPLNSSMIATAPLADHVWREIGWDGCETLSDGAHVYVYAQRTADGRIAIGGRGVPYRFGSRTDRLGETQEQTVRQLSDVLHGLLPATRDVPIDHTWSGVLGVPRDWTPSVGLDPATGLGYAGGYVGIGVAASNLAARCLADLVLERETDLTSLPIVGHPWRHPVLGTGPAAWEPEPLRYFGSRAIYGLLREADRREERTGRPSRLARVAHALSGM